MYITCTGHCINDNATRFVFFMLRSYYVVFRLVLYFVACVSEFSIFDCPSNFLRGRLMERQ